MSALRVCFFMCIWAGVASSATYYWDPNTTNAGFGTAGGTWGAATNWTTDATGAFGGTTTNITTTADALNFGSATLGLDDGTITVTGTVNAANLTFGAASSNLVFSGGKISLGVNQFINGFNALTTINSDINVGGFINFFLTAPSSPSQITLTGTLTAGSSMSIYTANGTLEIAGEGQINANAIFNNVVYLSGTLKYNSTKDQYVATLQNSGGNLIKDNSGKLTINSGNLFNPAGFAINNGILNFNSTAAFGGTTSGGTITMNGGTLQWTGNVLDISSRLVMVNGKTATFDTQANNVTFASGIGSNSTASLVKTGTGILTLSGINSYTGSTTVNAGQLALNYAQLSGGGAVNINTGAVLSGSGTITGPVTLDVNATLLPGGSNAVGTLALSSLTLPVGTTNVFDFAALGASNDLVTVSGALTAGVNRIAINLLDRGHPPVSGTYPLFTYGTLNGIFDTSVLGNSFSHTVWMLDTNSPGAVNLVVSGSVSNLVWNPSPSSGNLWNVLDRQSWTNTSLGGVSDFGNGDSVAFDDTGVAFSNGVVNIAATVSPAMMTVSAAGNYTLGGTGRVSGPVTALLKLGAGTLTISNSGGNDFGGGTVLSNGWLAVGVASALGTNSSPIVFNGGTLQSAAGVSLGNSTITLNTGINGIVETPAYALTFAGIVGGAGHLTKYGAGTLTLSGANTFTGGSTVSAGTLYLLNTTAAGTGSITLGDGNTGADNVTLVAQSGTVNVGGITVVNQGGGTATLSLVAQNTGLNSLITLNRPTTITSAASPGGAYVNYQGAGKITGNVGTLTLQSTTGLLYIGNNGVANTFVGTVLIPQGGVYVFPSAGLAFGATNAVVMSGTAALGLYSSPLTIGDLTGAPGNTVNTSANGSQILAIINSNAVTFAGTISGTGSLVKGGIGAQTLGGTNTYSGSTTVNGGSLIVDGRKTGVGAVVVNSGATLGGTGTVSGAISIAAGATLSPGDVAANGGMGTLTASNAVTLASNATFAVQIAPGVSDSLVSLASVTNVNATLSVSVLPGMIRGGTKYTVLRASAMIGTFRGLPEGAGIMMSGQHFQVSYPGGTNVILEAISSGMLLMVQ